MANLINKLTGTVICAANTPSLVADGHGLYLQVSRSLTKSWVFRFSLNGKTREMGLGRVDDRSAKSATQSLNTARDLATAARTLVQQGIDPITARDEKKAEAVTARAQLLTFRQATEQCMANRSSKWRNVRSAAKWRASLEAYAFDVLGDVSVAAIDNGLVCQVLDPIWPRIPETADRVRSRIQIVLDWAKSGGHRTGDNPARWTGHLEHRFVRPAGEKEHHASMALADLPAFIGKLRAQGSVAARCLEFAILTAARSGEATGALWSEIDLEARTWTVPATRMKAGKLHTVPLSDRAIEILAAQPRVSPRVFDGVDSLYYLLNKLVLGCTVHGFRSTFRNWVRVTGRNGEIAELALAHNVGTVVEQAYATDKAVEPRRVMMQDWAAVCGGQPATGQVIPLHSVA